jgi:hypothetical protein
MEITHFSLTRLNLASKIQFFENTISVINANDPALLRLESKFITLRNRWQELSSLYIIDEKNPLSQEIFNLDLQRDECVWAAWLLIEGHSHSPITANRLAGQRLLRNFSLYAESPSAFARQRYDVQTNNITNLLNGWNNDPELADAVEQLSLTNITTALATINSQHNVKFLARNEMYATETTESSKQKLIETTIAYYDLCRALNAMAYVTPSPLYDKTISELNTLISSAELSLRQSTGHRRTISPEVL